MVLLFFYFPSFFYFSFFAFFSFFFLRLFEWSKKEKNLGVSQSVSQSVSK